MWFRIFVLALGTFAIGTDSFIIAGILPDLAQGLHVSLAQAGLSVTVFALVYAFAAPILATFTGKLERRRVLLISLVTLTVANLLAALAPNLFCLIGARVLAALGASLYTPTASAVATMLAPERLRGRALAVVITGLTVSTVLGVPLGIIIGSWLNWQASLVFVALLCLLALLGIFALFPTVAVPPAFSLRTRLAFLARPGLLIALLQTALYIAGVQIVYTYARPLLQQIGHFTDVMVSVLLLLFGLAGFAGGFLGGYGADRWGSIRTIIGCLIVLVASFLLLPWAAATLVSAVPVLLIWGSSGWAINPAQQHRLTSVAPEAAGVILSLNSSALYLGISGGSALGGLLVQSTSMNILCWIAAGWELATLVFILSTAHLLKAAQHNDNLEVSAVPVPLSSSH